MTLKRSLPDPDISDLSVKIRNNLSYNVNSVLNALLRATVLIVLVSPIHLASVGGCLKYIGTLLLGHKTSLFKNRLGWQTNLGSLLGGKFSARGPRAVFEQFQTSLLHTIRNIGRAPGYSFV